MWVKKRSNILVATWKAFLIWTICHFYAFSHCQIILLGNYAKKCKLNSPTMFFYVFMLRLHSFDKQNWRWAFLTLSHSLWWSCQRLDYLRAVLSSAAVPDGRWANIGSLKKGSHNILWQRSPHGNTKQAWICRLVLASPWRTWCQHVVLNRCAKFPLKH